jgi:hypothetical protein
LTVVKVPVRDALPCCGHLELWSGNMPDTIGDAFLWMSIAGAAIFLVVLAYAAIRDVIDARGD